ncbi:unnamed protein product [Gordionus sp. m RMFG-2023]|uniref:Kv channel-interacting protein 4-like n=1 Tax=Gordionus sp. m RMFG-2023 TaxID=3053472 RepID=UPI0030E24D98
MAHLLTRYVGSLHRRASYRFSAKGKEPENIAEVLKYYRPESLEKLCRKTKFTKKEIQHFYQNFKQQFPKGAINQEDFKSIFAQIFLSGRPEKYADMVFATLNKDNLGLINFETLLIFISTVSRGSKEENYEWIFHLYDINRDGFVTKNEILDVAIAIYYLQNPVLNPPTITRIIAHVDNIFKKMDTKSYGAVNREEFIEFCNDKKWDILESIEFLKTNYI